MKQSNDSHEQSRHRYRVYAQWAAIAAGATLLALTAFLCLPSEKTGPAQPIPFSHRLHAGEKTISCYVCHGGAAVSEHAGIPPLETCMLCHERIIIDYPPIQDLRESYRSKIPVNWVRVNDLPDYVYFNHQVHMRRGFDCGRCHGNVAGMDRVVESTKLNMGYCVQCHRDNGASHDCSKCHR